MNFKTIQLGGQSALDFEMAQQTVAAKLNLPVTDDK